MSTCTCCMTFFKDLLNEDPPLPNPSSCRSKTESMYTSGLISFKDLLKDQTPPPNSSSCLSETKPVSTISYTSFNDLLKEPKLTVVSSPSYSKKNEFGYEATTMVEDPYVTEMFGELYFKESSNGVSISELFPPIQTQTQTSFQANIDISGEKVGEMEEKCHVRREDVCVYSNISGREVKMFPSPVRSLRSLKVGTPFAYLEGEWTLGYEVDLLME